jgi:branched-chain amino acid transport system substrate-binding protein
MRRRQVIAGLAGAVSTATLYRAAGADPARPRLAGPSVPPITVALIASLTGPDALGPIDAVDGFLLGLKDKARHLGIREVKTVLLDDQGSPDVALAQARTLVAGHRPDFVLTAVWPAALATILPVLAGAGCFVVNLAPAPAAMAGSGCDPFLFDMVGRDAGLHRAAGLRMTADRVRTLAVVAPDSPLTPPAIAALTGGFSGRLAETLVIGRGAMTYGGILERIAARKVDAVYSLLTGGTGVDFVRARGRAKGRVPLYAPWTGFVPAYLAAMGPAALGTVTLGTWAEDLDNPTNAKLVKDFRRDYGRSATAWAAQGYDAFQLLNAALDLLPPKALRINEVRKVLRTVPFPSARGSFAFDTDQFPILDIYARTVARDGRGRLFNHLREVTVADWHDPAAAACPMRWRGGPPSGGR